MHRIPVSSVLLVKNSAAMLPAYYASIKDIDDIIVLDGNSTDGTLDIVRQWPNARIFPQDPTYLDEKGYITNFSALRNQGYALAKHKWILCIDSDEEATTELMDDVRRIVKDDTRGVYYVKRHFYFQGERVKQPSWIESDHIRFFHLDWVRGCLKATHEKLDIVDGAPIYHLKSAVKLPMASPESLRPKFNRNMAIEVKMYSQISFARWFRWIFLRNIISIIPRPFIFVGLRFKPGPGKCAPFIYDYEQIRYSWLLIWKTMPALRQAQDYTKA